MYIVMLVMCDGIVIGEVTFIMCTINSDVVWNCRATSRIIPTRTRPAPTRVAWRVLVCTLFSFVCHVPLVGDVSLVLECLSCFVMYLLFCQVSFVCCVLSCVPCFTCSSCLSCFLLMPLVFAMPLLFVVSLFACDSCTNRTVSIWTWRT